MKRERASERVDETTVEVKLLLMHRIFSTISFHQARYAMRKRIMKPMMVEKQRLLHRLLTKAPPTELKAVNEMKEAICA